MAEEIINQGVEEGDKICLLYTSDAADERSSVDLGGRRIIKKKKSADSTVWVTNTDKSLSDNTLRKITQTHTNTHMHEHTG